MVDSRKWSPTELFVTCYLSQEMDLDLNSNTRDPWSMMNWKEGAACGCWLASPLFIGGPSSSPPNERPGSQIDHLSTEEASNLCSQATVAYSTVAYLAGTGSRPSRESAVRTR
jgi:hypothetical protein